MAVEEAIVSILEADAGVSALVGSGDAARIYPNPAPHGVASPFITYQTIGINGIGHAFNDGKPAHEEMVLQIDCWAESETNPAAFTQVRGVAAAVRSALVEHGGTSSGVTINRIWFTDGRDLPEEGWRRRQLDFSIWLKGV